MRYSLPTDIIVILSKPVTKRYLTLLLMLITLNLFSQTANKIFIGAETGININQSDYVNDTQNISMQIGILGEYLINKNISIMGKLKYFKSTVTFNYSRITGSTWFGNKYQFSDADYNGEILSIPLTLNYTFKIYNKLSGSVRIGPSFNYKLSSIYNYPAEVNIDYSKTFIGLNSGFNLNYDIGKSIIFFGFEPYYGAKRGSTSGKGFSEVMHTQNYRMENILLNIGIKCKLN
jgi:hypothetical protein